MRGKNALAATKPRGSPLRAPLRLENVVSTPSINEKFNREQKTSQGSTLSVSHTKQPHNMTASKRYTKICKWLNRWIVLLLFALSILLTAAIAAFASFAVTLLR
jgi:hypothetical protein